MTAPRPPRAGGPRRTPKVAGRQGLRQPAPADEQATTASDATDTAAADTVPVETAPVETVVTPPDPESAPAEPTPPSPPETPAAGDGPRGKNRPTTKVSTLKPARRTARAASSTPAPAAVDDRPARRSLFGWRAVGIVAALAVVFAIIAGVAALKPGVSLTSNGAFVDSAVTSEVTAQAKSRICTIFAVKYDNMDGWQKTAASNVTGEAAARFGQFNTAVRDALAQSGLTGGGTDCRVDSVGVRSIDGGNAVLLVNLILSQTQDQQATGSGTKRYQVSMSDVGGKWLISNFADF